MAVPGRSALRVSAWFIGCVSLGLAIAYADGIALHAILAAGLTMAVAALALAALAWVVQAVRDRR